ncbi:MAG: FtsQ-type POTRA domain-containing protein [Clostridia bacterium]|nr:FtsQ-type POTRA domain-containing protein [Clostridia bacterium]
MERQNRSQRSYVPQNSTAGRSPRTSRNSKRAMQRRAKRRKQGKMVRRVIFVLLIVIAIVMAPTVFFRVSKVTVVGDTRYTEQELIRTSGVQEGDNMFFLDTKHIASLLEAKYPYLDTIKLHRRMPSTLQIEVSDRTAVLSLENNGKYLLMDITGKVLEETVSAADNTTEVIGASPDDLKPGDTVDKEHEKILAVLRLMELMTQYEMDTSIRSVDIDKAYDVRVQYEDRYTILLGSMDEEQLEHKIQFLQAILKEPSLPDNGIIDLTDDSEARYRPQEDSTSNKTVVFEDDVLKDTTAQDADASGDDSENNTEEDTSGDDAEEDNSGDSTEEDAPDSDGAADETGDTSTGFVWAGNFMLRAFRIG